MNQLVPFADRTAALVAATGEHARRSLAWLAFSVMINVAMIHAESNAAFSLAHRREQIKNNGNHSINRRGKVYCEYASR